MAIHALDLTNSGTDFACDDCLEQAVAERDGQVSGVTTVFDDDDVECGWCFLPNVEQVTTDGDAA